MSREGDSGLEKQESPRGVGTEGFEGVGRGWVLRRHLREAPGIISETKYITGVRVRFRQLDADGARSGPGGPEQARQHVAVEVHVDSPSRFDDRQRFVCTFCRQWVQTKSDRRATDSIRAGSSGSCCG